MRYDIESLKKEYNLRYKIIRYNKLYKQVLYPIIEKHNYNMLYRTLENMKVVSDYWNQSSSI